MEGVTFIQQLNTILNVLALVGIIAGIFVYFRYRVTSATIEMYQTNQTAFETRITELERQLVASDLKMTAMQSQIDVVKDLPLRDIANTLSKLVDTQNTILTTQTTILNHISAIPAAPITVNTAPQTTP